MSDAISLLRAAAHPGNTDGVTATPPTKRYRPEKCEFAIHIGVFFDGTRNNQNWHDPDLGGATHLERKKDSNVARLYRAYPSRPLEGHYPVYIPGVGTPFPAIGENGASMLGMGFAAGGDARIVFGLLHVLNAMHRSINSYDAPMIEAPTIKALCSNAWLPLQTGGEGQSNRLSLADQRALEKVGMQDKGGLLTHNGISHRTEFLKEQFALLAQKIDDTKHPKLVEVFIDVFGFSRGAAEARVFCNWLDECFDGDTLAGVTTHIRFLGIFDTVAAVGLGPAASRWTNGHEAWGETQNLKISPRVRHCEHYVAMHEQRESFPLEDIQTPGDAMPPRCRQFRFPGMHSDVGGGYLPEEQGKNGADDENKLARIPLNMMYVAARAANVPIDSTNATIADGWDSFEMGDALQLDYHAFLQANGTGERAITDCLIDILAWRYLYRHVYDTLPFVQASSDKDKHDLLGAQRIFMKDIGEDDAVDAPIKNTQQNASTSKLSWGRVFGLNRAEQNRAQPAPEKSTMPETRRQVFDQLIRRKPGDVELAFFSAYCHDSFAGFTPFATARAISWIASRNAPWESGGYLRYRTRYAGESLRLAMLEAYPQNDQESAEAA